MAKVSIYTDELFLKHDTGPHPECPERIKNMEKSLRTSSLRELLEWRSGKPATDKELLRCHTTAHVARVDSAAGRRGAFDQDTVYSADTSAAARLAVGVVKGAAERLYTGADSGVSAFCLVRPPGHHATSDRAMGFCFFNNVAVAARHLQALGCKRVLIIDWDVHHGNGTQDIFYDDPTVFYYSLHAHPHYPGTGLGQETGSGDGQGTTLNRPLPHGFPAAQFRSVFEQDLKKIWSDFVPDFTILSCGFDSHCRDPLGALMLEREDFEKLTRLVIGVAPRGRVLSVLEGGYNLDTLGSLAVGHVEAMVAAEKRPGRDE